MICLPCLLFLRLHYDVNVYALITLLRPSDEYMRQ